MSEKTGIAWTDHTFNPWWGCAKVSPGCYHCYAERDAARYQPHVPLWGVDAQRRIFGPAHWNEPRKWDRAAAKAGIRRRVFCASMADVFDKAGPPAELAKLWALIRETPHLDWLLLTKRIGNAKACLPSDWGAGYPNVWLGISVVNQEEVGRDVPKLLKVPATIRFLSCEPMLGPIDLLRVRMPGAGFINSLTGRFEDNHGRPDDCCLDRIDWVIVGGESGPKAREMKGLWLDPLLRQCQAAGVAFFFKQGSQNNWPTFRQFETFPPYLQVREWPTPCSAINL